mgnify:FL=1
MEIWGDKQRILWHFPKWPIRPCSTKTAIGKTDARHTFPWLRPPNVRMRTKQGKYQAIIQCFSSLVKPHQHGKANACQGEFFQTQLLNCMPSEAYLALLDQ